MLDRSQGSSAIPRDPPRRIIEVVSYNADWPAQFELETSGISEALGAHVLRAHHIGSTAVPGLMAKPTIDILLEVADVDRLDSYDAAMEALGFLPRGEFGIPGRRFYIKGLQVRTHHVHAFRAGSPDVRRHLAFRDYLIAQPDVAEGYAELKARCARQCNHDNEQYCQCKDAFVLEHEKLALEWASRDFSGDLGPTP